jgi:hypothetical protein
LQKLYAGLAAELASLAAISSFSQQAGAADILFVCAAPLWLIN